jgi:PAS domain S-box-containing protein
MNERLILSAIPHAIIATDVAGLITFWSRGAERLYGWTSDEVLGRHIADVTVPTPAAESAESILDELRSGRDWSGAFRVQRRDGSQFIALVTDGPIVDEHGVTIGVVGISAPLDSFDAPQLVRESEMFYREIVDTAQEGIIMSDAAGRVVYVNDRFYEMLALPPGSVIGRHILELIITEERDRVGEKMRRRRQEKTSEQYELRMLRGDGSPLWALIEAVPLLDAEGAFRGARGTIIDITSRKESEERLMRREQQLRNAQKVARIVAWEFDLKTRMLESENPQPAAGGEQTVLRLSAAEALQRVHPADRERVMEALAQTELTGNVFDVEHRIAFDDGKYRIVHTRGELLHDDDGTPVRIAGIVQNISEQKRLEDRLQQSERISSLGRLAASVAHEFNNVLMGIQPFAELIAKRSTTEDTIGNAARQIIGSVARGKRVTQEILRFTRTPDPVLRPIAVASWLHFVEPELRQLAGSHVAVHVNAPEGVAMSADDQQLQQVLSNLAANAGDAMPNGGDLYIDAVEDLGYVHFTVRDTGTGMSAETLNMIFQPLFTTKKTGGTGLGLAIAFQVMQRHEGDIWAESEEGRGTTFHLRVPVSRDTPVVASHGAAPAAPTQTRWPFARITLIEDNSAVAAGIASMLEFDGVAVDIVSTGGEAISRIEAHRPDAVVLDLGLPDISGVAVYGAIAERWPDLPVLFSTGHGDERLLSDILARPNVAYLQKPYETDALLTEMRKLRSATES